MDNPVTWACYHCGPHKDSTSMWCAAGCGRDYPKRMRRWVDPSNEETPAGGDVERLAEFLLEHARCGDDYWVQCNEARKNWYRGLAGDVLAHLASPHTRRPRMTRPNYIYRCPQPKCDNTVSLKVKPIEVACMRTSHHNRNVVVAMKEEPSANSDS